MQNSLFEVVAKRLECRPYLCSTAGAQAAYAAGVVQRCSLRRFRDALYNGSRRSVGCRRGSCVTHSWRWGDVLHHWRRMLELVRCIPPGR